MPGIHPVKYNTSNQQQWIAPFRGKNIVNCQKNRQEKESSLSDKKYLEVLGNKVLLEKRINIRASDYRFSDKKKYYIGEIKQKEKTCVSELFELSNQDDFNEKDIIVRNQKIIDTFIDYLKKEDLLID